jgi:hypothetical protein
MITASCRFCAPAWYHCHALHRRDYRQRFKHGKSPSDAKAIEVISKLLLTIQTIKNNKHHVELHVQINLSIYAAISLTAISTGSNTTPALTFKASNGSNMDTAESQPTRRTDDHPETIYKLNSSVSLCMHKHHTLLALAPSSIFSPADHPQLDTMAVLSTIWKHWGSSPRLVR